MIQPVLTEGAEEIELERVLEGFGLMGNPRRDVQHFTLAQRDLLAAYKESECALEHVRHLLALM
jgi:hypothetical protein